MFSRNVFRIALIAALLLASAAWSPSLAQRGQGDDKSKTQKTPQAKRSATITPEKEKAVLKLLKEHYPELAELLPSLKSARLRDYQRAIRDLSRSQARLSQIKQQGDMDRYELELKGWVAQLRVSLVLAKMKMGVSDELKSDLRKAIAVQQGVKLELLKRERQRASDRLKKIDDQIKKLSVNAKKNVESQFNSLTKNLNRSSKKNTKTRKKIVDSKK